MENDYGTDLENYDAEYISEEYAEEDAQQTYDEPTVQTVATPQQQQIYVQPGQVIAQPIYTQPVITQPVYAQPIYTQPVIMQTVEPEYNDEQLSPVEPTYPAYPIQSYLPIEELKAERWQAPPVLVLFALLLCFPIGLVLLIFFTRWGAFPKIFLTFFTLLCIWFAYEIFAFYSGLGLPGLLNGIL